MERNASPEQSIRFAEFKVDPRAGELRKLGVKIKLQEQPLQVLAMLLEHPGEVVTREELQQRIWPADTSVDFENGLNKAINKLREALGDSAENPRFVETLPRHGYRFIASLDRVVEQQGGHLAEGRHVGVPPQSRRWLAAVGGAAILGSLIFSLNLAGLRERLFGNTAARPIQSIAVLPLVNLSGDATQEYFADGMTEALITELGRLGAFRVISRTSAMHYKASKKTLPEIARELNVDAIVEGAVLRSENRVRITTKLIRATPENQLWAESYERDLRDTLLLQGDIARAIAREVHIMLSPESQIRLASGRRQVNLEAYDIYLKGRYEASKWTAEGRRKSIQYFEQSIQKDPTYAEAWAGLANVYGLNAAYRLQAMQAALRALELDETVPEAHTALALVKHWEWVWGAARKELQRAIALDPNNAEAHQFSGYNFIYMGRYDEAVAEMQRAVELDPFEGNKRNSLGAALLFARRDDEALEQYRQVPDPDVNSETRHSRMAEIYARKGMRKEAINEVLTALRLAGEKDLAVLVEQKYLSAGYAEARKTWLRGDIRELQRNAKDGQIRSFRIAGDYAWLGEKDKAFEWLEKAFQERDPALINIKSAGERFWDLQSDPRFQDLLRRMSLPP